MRVTTKICWDLETGAVLAHDFYEYSGPTAKCLGGATSGEKGLAEDEEQLYESITNEQQSQFQQEQQAQQQVQKAWAPIVSGGAYQYGFSTAEDQLQQQQIENAGAQATENTENAAQLREQQATGGAGGGPAGGTEALNAQIAATGAQQTATNLGQEKELGYEVGRQNFEEGTAAEESVAGLANPVGYAGAANQSAGEAMQGQQLVDTANANSLTSKLLGGIVGGLPAAAGSVVEGLQGGGGASGVASSLAGMFV